MRVKRVTLYKRNRRQKAKKIVFFTLLVPCFAIFMGYLIFSVIISPNIK